MNPPDEMIVATHLEWVWRDLVAGVDGRWPIRRDRGHHLPELQHRRTAWWTPTSHAARLVAAGLDLHLTATPPGWLAALEHELTGRYITTVSLGDALGQPSELPRSGFAKPALAKLAELPAAWHDDLHAALQRARRAGIHPDSVLEITPQRLDLQVEYRSFVIDGTPSRPSPYLISGQSWEPEFDRRSDVHIEDAHRYVGTVAAEMHRQGRAPDAYVLDVARKADGSFLVVEANAAWSSGTYGCDLRDVAETVAAASTPPADPQWRWQPDPTEHAAAQPFPTQQ